MEKLIKKIFFLLIIKKVWNMNQKKTPPGFLTYAPAPSSRERIKMPVHTLQHRVAPTNATNRTAV